MVCGEQVYVRGWERKNIPPSLYIFFKKKYTSTYLILKFYWLSPRAGFIPSNTDVDNSIEVKISHCFKGINFTIEMSYWLWRTVCCFLCLLFLREKLFESFAKFGNHQKEQQKVRAT